MTSDSGPPVSRPDDATFPGPVLNALPPGHRLLEYSLDTVLGYGGFGITYLATDHNLNCKVAIKEYLPADQAVRADGHTLEPKSTTASEIFHWGLSRFLDEARALATFNHPNIVRVLRFFEANNTAYMVMELIEGQPLGEWIKRNRPIEEARLLAIVRPLLDGLIVIHAAGFLHRDVKPGNVHMRTDTDPVLLDFGAARRLINASRQDLTAIITPGYAALEQYHSQGNQGPWSDVYSMAAVMYNMITGRRPIEATARARNDPLPKAREVGDRAIYSDELLRAVDWGLVPEEEKRPQSVQSFADALPGAAPLARAGSGTPLAPVATSSGPASAPVTLAAEVVAQLEAALASHLGPMAAVLVRRSARTQPTLAALREALADEIDNEQSRRSFLHRTETLLRTGPPSQPAPITLMPPTEPIPPRAPPRAAAPEPFDPQFLAAVEAELANHLGPLARVLVKKSVAKARDRAELFLLLSDNIADPDQRRAFIRKSVAAFKSKT